MRRADEVARRFDRRFDRVRRRGGDGFASELESPGTRLGGGGAFQFRAFGGDFPDKFRRPIAAQQRNDKARAVAGSPRVRNLHRRAHGFGRDGRIGGNPRTLRLADAGGFESRAYVRVFRPAVRISSSSRGRGREVLLLVQTG